MKFIYLKFLNLETSATSHGAGLLYVYASCNILRIFCRKALGSFMFAFNIYTPISDFVLIHLLYAFMSNSMSSVVKLLAKVIYNIFSSTW